MRSDEMIEMIKMLRAEQAEFRMQLHRVKGELVMVSAKSDDR